MASSNIPQWLSKQSSDSYILSVLKFLASREAERESARRLSVQQDPEPNHSESTPSNPRFMALNRLFRSSSPSKTISTASRDYYSVAIAHHPDNQARNRYMDIHPYDRTRVIVNDARGTDRQVPERQEGQYLNASWVLERYGRKWWIASQAALPNTAYTFLSLFVQPISSPAPYNDLSTQRKCHVRTVVQLTNEIEGGRRKAHPYFPDTIGQSVIIRPERDDGRLPFSVTLVDRETIETAHCILSTVSITPISLTKPPHGPDTSHTEYIQGNNLEQDAKGDSMGETKGSIIFRHMLYTAWPDHGVPKANNRASLLAFMRLVDSKNRDVSLTSTPDYPEVDPDPPIVVGCSAGIGRTGSFVAMSSLLRHYDFLSKPDTPSDPSVIPPSPLGAISPDLSEDLVVQEIDSLREQRPRMVERNEQVILIYEMLTFAFAV